MAMTTNVPPQAYTRDTLVKAIEWMTLQPAAVRERANSADLVVSYYLQARRRMTAAQMEAPVSGESFKADLRHLAEDLKKFEKIAPSPPHTHPSRSPSLGQFDHLQEISIPRMEVPMAPSARLYGTPTPPPPLPPPPRVAPPPVSMNYAPPLPLYNEPATPPPPQEPPRISPTASPAAAPPKVITWAIDPRSLASARELQQRMNLSSETEAIRMLVTLGMERMREIFRT